MVVPPPSVDYVKHKYLQLAMDTDNRVYLIYRALTESADAIL